MAGTARRATDDIATEVGRLRDQPGEGVVSIGGAGLAAAAIAEDLIDEYRPRSSLAAEPCTSRRSPNPSTRGCPSRGPSPPASSTFATSACAELGAEEHVRFHVVERHSLAVVQEIL